MDPIFLIDRGSTMENRSLLPVDISRLKCNLFGCKNHNERSSGPNAPHYSEKVLIGNWFERRSVNRRQPDEWITINNEHYKTHDIKNTIEDVFTLWKNKQKIQGTDRAPIIDDYSYLDNMTTLYDLNYRILPKDLCGPKIRRYKPRKNAWVPEADLTLSYGNQTKYGRVDVIKSKQYQFNREDRDFSPWTSIYKFDYDKPAVVDANNVNIKRFPKRKADMNTPDLRNLGIILPSTAKDPIREPQYRSSRFEKICTWL